MAPLRDALAALRDLTHDELADLVDMLRFDLDPESAPPRHGKPPIADYVTGRNYVLSGGWQRTPDSEPTPPARRVLRDAYEAATTFDDDDRRALIDQAAVLRDALAPREKRKQRDGQPVARGTVQAKIIPRNVVVVERDAQGEVIDIREERRLFGPYLYIRVWATGGGRGRDERRLKNHYVGKAGGLAELYHATPRDSAERRELEARIIEAWERGELAALAGELFGRGGDGEDEAAD